MCDKLLSYACDNVISSRVLVRVVYMYYMSTCNVHVMYTSIIMSWDWLFASSHLRRISFCCFLFRIRHRLCCVEVIKSFLWRFVALPHQCFVVPLSCFAPSSSNRVTSNGNQRQHYSFHKCFPNCALCSYNIYNWLFSYIIVIIYITI